MSSFKVDVAIDDDQLQRVLGRLLDAGADLRPAFEDIGETMLLSTEERFNSETDPDGRPWQELAPATRRQKKHSKILTESTDLRGSIHWLLTDDGVEWGTDKIYGAIHQLGGQAGRNRAVTLPARPYLGISNDDRDVILTILQDHLDETIK